MLKRARPWQGVRLQVNNEGQHLGAVGAKPVLWRAGPVLKEAELVLLGAGPVLQGVWPGPWGAGPVGLGARPWQGVQLRANYELHYWLAVGAGPVLKEVELAL